MNDRERVEGGRVLDVVQMGPVISQESRSRIETIICEAEREGGRVSVDGRNPSIRGYEGGNSVRPTIFEGLPEEGGVMRTEIFGPVLSLQEVDSMEAALERFNSGAYGNMACLFTSSGEAARRFRTAAEGGNIGINIGIAAPMAFLPLRWFARELLRRFACAGPRCGSVLHAGEGSVGEVAQGVVADILGERSCP